jgi:hypothetical protein
MSLLKFAQEILVVEPQEHMDFAMPSQEISLAPEEAIEVCEPEGSEHHHGHGHLEVEEQPIEVVIDMGDMKLDPVPGAPGAQEILEVKEEDAPEVEERESNDAEDVNDAKKPKGKWDWKSRGPQGFVAWVKERFDTVPRHNGTDSAGVERAASYLEKLDSEISKAMRLDVDGELDANKVEEIRCKIDDGIEALKDRLDKIRKSKKGNKKKSDFVFEGMVKEGQKITGVQGIYVTVPLLISGIARVLINGTVSAGHDLKEMYDKLVDKYKLNDREKTEVRWLLFDMGYPLRGDRGYLPDEEYDQTSSDNLDYAANYWA